MWVLLTGGVGTAKTALSSVLVEDGFISLGSDFRSTAKDKFQVEYEYFMNRLKLQREIRAHRNDSNVVTIRSIWDTIVFARAAVRSLEMSEVDCSILTEMVIQAHETAEKPDLVVYTYAPKIQARDRAVMKGNLDDSEMFLDSLSIEYNDFIENITVPMTEVDVSMPYNEMKNMLKFNLASIGSTRVAEETIWKKEFVNDIWMGTKN